MSMSYNIVTNIDAWTALKKAELSLDYSNSIVRQIHRYWLVSFHIDMGLVPHAIKLMGFSNILAKEVDP